jgi:EAL domain-containing protein (putative c-di-GMP-specific phosphodiesterase class I)
VISRMDDFTDAVRKLKGAGINLAIDHFGAGFDNRLYNRLARPILVDIADQLMVDFNSVGLVLRQQLSLLAQYQPDRIKIDHELIRNIHQDGPRQSIVQD